MVANIFLRSIWMLLVDPTFFGIYCDRRILVYALAVCEMVRRWNWNFFRLENEHLNNCGQFRATKDIPLPFPVRPKSVLYHDATRRRPISIITESITPEDATSPILSAASPGFIASARDLPNTLHEPADHDDETERPSPEAEAYATSRAYTRQDYAPSERPRSTLISSHAEHDASMLDLEDEEEEEELHGAEEEDVVERNLKQKGKSRRSSEQWPLERLLPIMTSTPSSRTVPSSPSVLQAPQVPLSADIFPHRTRSQTMRPLSTLFDQPEAPPTRTSANLPKENE